MPEVVQPGSIVNVAYFAPGIQNIVSATLEAFGRSYPLNVNPNGALTGRIQIPSNFSGIAPARV